MPKGIDSIRLEVIANGLDTIADEMALILMRSAYSTIVRDSMDYSTAICDSRGHTLAQGLTTPLHLGSFHDALAHLIGQYRGAIFPDDIFIGNDPYTAAGQHLPDIYIIKPIFVSHSLRGWATTLAHHADVGGIIPGSNALGAIEIFQEGLRLPFLKLYERGVRNDAIWQILATNVRIPLLVMGDLEAQIVAAQIGERKYSELYTRFPAQEIEGYLTELHNYAERLARQEIAAIPDGCYRFEHHIDGLGENPTPITLNVAITVEHDSISVNWTGSSKQVKGGINAPLPFTKAATYTAIRSIMRAEIPNCYGFTRPITVHAPLGTIVNPVSPAACGARGITGFRMIDCAFGALAKACPDRVAADGSGGSTLPTFAGITAQGPFVFSETLMGNWGGTSSHDGQEGVPHMGANQSNVPVELIECDYPIRVEQYGFVTDTGGPGRYRGGLAIQREYRVLQDDVLLSVRSDKRRFPPPGMLGGNAGTPSANLVNPGANERTLPVLTTEPLILKEGDRFLHVMAGAGGYGPAWERDPAAVVADVLAEKVSVAGARRAYGVIVTMDDPPLLDAEATLALRLTRGESAGTEPFGAQDFSTQARDEHRSD